MKHPIIEDLSWRYAVKKYHSERKIKEDDLQTLLESIRLAPSSLGVQPYQILLIQDLPLREQLFEASYKQKQVVEASHLLAFCAKTSFSEEELCAYIQLCASTRNVSYESLAGFEKMIRNWIDKLDEKSFLEWSTRQCYLVLGQFLHSCASMRIDATPMEGIDLNRYDDLLGLADKNLKCVLACPIGYRHPEDKYGLLPKVRKSLSEVIVEI